MYATYQLVILTFFLFLQIIVPTYPFLTYNFFIIYKNFSQNENRIIHVFISICIVTKRQEKKLNWNKSIWKQLL